MAGGEKKKKKGVRLLCYEEELDEGGKCLGKVLRREAFITAAGGHVISTSETGESRIRTAHPNVT